MLEQQVQWPKCVNRRKRKDGTGASAFNTQVDGFKWLFEAALPAFRQQNKLGAALVLAKSRLREG